jgi:hypothetical protein
MFPENSMHKNIQLFLKNKIIIYVYINSPYESINSTENQNFIFSNFCKIMPMYPCPSGFVREIPVHQDRTEKLVAIWVISLLCMKIKW